MIESALAVALALALDLALGDPRNRFHPTAWVGHLIGRIVPYGRSARPAAERAAGILLVLGVPAAVCLAIYGVYVMAAIMPGGALGIIVSACIIAVLLKTTIAVRGMGRHAAAVATLVEAGRMEQARESLSMIVKRDTSDLDKNHIVSGVLESVSENTVDGVTGPLFYFGFFGLFGAFVYRTVNTLDSMVGYRTRFFRDLGRPAANCDRILNYLPARLTGLVMVLASLLLGADWRRSYTVMVRDSSRPESPNAGYPMAALAGALDTTLEKPDHYTIGDGRAAPDVSHIRSSIILMKVTSLLFCGIITIPTIAALSYLGWWLHA